MFKILAKFFKFSGKENSKKFKLSIIIGVVDALSNTLKITAIIYVLILLLFVKLNDFLLLTLFELFELLLI